MKKARAITVQGHIGFVVQPVAAVQVTGAPLPVGRHHLEVQGQVAVSKNEAVIGRDGQHIPAIDLVRAKELAVQSMGALGTAETRGYAVNELDQIIAQTIESANIKVKNQYVFAGTAFRTQPFDQSASGAV